MTNYEKLTNRPLMTYGTGPRKDPLTVVKSTWIDITATEAEGNWIPDEGEAVERILTHLFKAGVDPATIMLITPFRDAAHELNARWWRTAPHMTCGTVHKAQGKEADVVLCVLGG